MCGQVSANIMHIVSMKNFEIFSGKAFLPLYDDLKNNIKKLKVFLEE